MLNNNGCTTYFDSGMMDPFYSSPSTEQPEPFDGCPLKYDDVDLEMLLVEFLPPRMERWANFRHLPVVVACCVRAFGA